MGANSKIQWTDHTFNPWVGCTPVSPGCDNCYAAARAKRCGEEFSARRVTSAANWRLPRKWDRDAAKAAHLIRYYGTGGQHGQPSAPLHTVTAKDRLGLVAANLALEAVRLAPMDFSMWEDAYRCARFVHTYDPPKGGGGATSWPVILEVGAHVVDDIGMRMLTPRELFRAQGFRDSYRIDVEVSGKPISKAAQVRAVGNSVCPDVMEALVRANLAGAQGAHLFTRAECS